MIDLKKSTSSLEKRLAELERNIPTGQTGTPVNTSD